MFKQAQFNKTNIINSFNQVVSSYDKAAVLQREVAKRLVDRLQLMSIKPQRIVDLGAGTGIVSGLLARKYPEAQLTSLDLAGNLLQHARKKLISYQHACVCGDAEQLPLANNSIDLIISNLMLHWCDNLSHVFREVQRVLKPGGLLLFSTLGPGTLIELKQSWALVDNNIHVHNFMDMHDVGDIMLQSQLRDSVLDMENIVLHYSETKQLLMDLKRLGTHNLAKERWMGLTGKQKLQSFYSAYQQFKTDNDKYPATYEVIYGHAWGSDVSSQYPLSEQETAIPLHQLR